MTVPARPRRKSPPHGAGANAPALTRPQWSLVIAVAAAIVVAATSYRMYDPDLWQHLRVGRTIWETHAVPHANVWTWPTYGQPYVLPSWLFRALLWPAYAVGGVAALAVWRWLAALVAFGIAGLTARRMGARSLAVVVAITWCALLYRQRSMVRPETLVVVLLALQMWILEARRRHGRDLSWLLVPLACVWANIHVSYYLSLLLTGFHVLDEGVAALRRRPGAVLPLRLVAVLLASAAACFVNPFGWSALAQPFHYYFEWRHQPLYRQIVELHPIVWETHALDGLIVWVVLAPALFVLRAVRGRGRLADALLYALFLPTALGSQRFLGVLAVAAAPVFACDLDDALRGVRLPAALRSGWVRAAGVSALLVAGALAPLSVEPWRPGYGIAWEALPVRACDWIARHDVRGPSFAPFHFGGYQLWRFWPQRDRLPFMDIHQTGTRADQDLYAACSSSESAWRALDANYRFEWVLLSRAVFPGQDLVDRMDADTTTWALVFADDVAALYLRRGGRLAATAERERYRIVPAGTRALARLQPAEAAGGEQRAELRAEFERQVRESEWTWQAHSGLATCDVVEGRWSEALVELGKTRAINPNAPMLAERERTARDALLRGGR